MTWLAAVASADIDVGSLLGGIGIGAIVGAALGYLNGERQRANDRKLRVLDHQHELALKQFEDKQRLRDRRLVTLQDGLTETVEGLVDLTEIVRQMRFGDAGREEADRANQAAGEHFNRARPRLILDPAGREVMETFRKVHIEIGALATMYRGQEALLQAHQPDAVRHGEEIAAQDRKIIQMLSDAVDRAQQIMEEAAQPVTS